MKKIVTFLSLLLLSCVGVSAQQSFAPTKGNNPAGPIAEFEKNSHDFGTILQDTQH
ncbi:MAG: hypothetical protein NW226_25105 [Microscillaceae bacterium]|nr:hypothetical protein [Microscillaceae bacterium]